MENAVAVATPPTPAVHQWEEWEMPFIRNTREALAVGKALNFVLGEKCSDEKDRRILLQIVRRIEDEFNGF